MSSHPCIMYGRDIRAQRSLAHGNPEARCAQGDELGLALWSPVSKAWLPQYPLKSELLSLKDLLHFPRMFQLIPPNISWLLGGHLGKQDRGAQPSTDSRTTPTAKEPQAGPRRSRHWPGGTGPPAGGRVRSRSPAPRECVCVSH